MPHPTPPYRPAARAPRQPRKAVILDLDPVDGEVALSALALECIAAEQSGDRARFSRMFSMWRQGVDRLRPTGGRR